MSHRTPEDFDPIWYLQTYADVREAGLDPWDHYLRIGYREGRYGGPARALELDHMLWRGYDDTALPALRKLLNEGPAREQALAGWALARWEKDQGHAAAAFDAIKCFHAHPEGTQALPHLGPFLLGIQLAVECGDIEYAENILGVGITHFGYVPDLELAALQVAHARHRDDWELSHYLARIYVPHGVMPIRLQEQLDGPRFDRLESLSPPVWFGSEPDTLPLVSVIVPMFNNFNSLPAAVRGIQAQTWPNLEILIVDDGSTDGSRELASHMAEQDPRIRLIEHPISQGACAAYNSGFAEAKGDFITIHEAEDWSHPQKVELQARALMNNTELQATVSHWVCFGNDLDIPSWHLEEAWTCRNISSLMVRAAVRDTLGYWDRVKVNADSEYYHRILATYGKAAILEVCQGLPLTFGRAETYLRSIQHTVPSFRTAQRSYMEAAHHWHQLAETPQDLYLPQHPERRPFRIPPQISLGDPEGPASAFDILSVSPLFDPDWYRLNHTDVLYAGLSPVRHYLEGGARENRDPGPLFSTGGYRQAQGLDADTNPLLHFETEGRAAGADPLPTFAGALSIRSEAEAPPCTLVFAHTSGKTLFGAERSLLDVVERMAQRGQRPVVVMPALRNMGYLERLRAITVAVETLPQLWWTVGRPANQETVAKIRGLIQKYGATELHVNTMVLDAPLIAARAEGCKSVVHVRELPAQDVALRRHLGADAETLRLQLLEQADRFVATSQPVADWLGCPERTDIRPNSVDEDLFSIPFEPGQSLNIALISSNLAKKGISDFLAVARLVENEGRPIRFLLIGPPTRDLHLTRPWPGCVDFRDYAASPKEALEQADIVLSLSKFAESFGRTVMEAMAAGRPVVCYDRGAPPFLVESGVSGLVVPADEPQGVANAILALEAARNQLQKISMAARSRARELQDQALQA